MVSTCSTRQATVGGEPAYITDNPWWGKGGMFDYTNDDCGENNVPGSPREYQIGLKLRF